MLGILGDNLSTNIDNIIRNGEQSADAGWDR